MSGPSASRSTVASSSSSSHADDLDSIHPLLKPLYDERFTDEQLLELCKFFTDVTDRPVRGELDKIAEKLGPTGRADNPITINRIADWFRVGREYARDEKCRYRLAADVDATIRPTEWNVPYDTKVVLGLDEFLSSPFFKKPGPSGVGNKERGEEEKSENKEEEKGEVVEEKEKGKGKEEDEKKKEEKEKEKDGEKKEEDNEKKSGEKSPAEPEKQESRGTMKKLVDNRPEESQLGLVSRRVRSHYQQFVGSNQKGLFDLVTPAIYPGDDIGKRSDDLRDLCIAWLDSHPDFVVSSSGNSDDDDKLLSELVLSDCVEWSTWPEYIAFLRANPDTPSTILQLIAISEVTNFRVFCITSAEGEQYVLDIAPASGKIGVAEFGLIRLAHWAFTKWERLEDSPDQDIYVTPKMEKAVLSGADALLKELRNLSTHQLKDINFPEAMMYGLENWIRTRFDADYVRANRVFACGLGGDYALGTNLNHSTNVPTAMSVDDLLTDGNLYNIPIKKTAVGNTHTFILREDGRLYCVGTNKYGQLGTNDLQDRMSVELVKSFADKTVTDVACGPYHSLILTADQGLFSAGYGKLGQLGDGSKSSSTLAVRTVEMPLPRGQRIVQLACGGDFSAALTAMGDLYTWGENSSGQLGVGWKPNTSSKPLLVADLEGRVRRIACGHYHMMATTYSGELFAWGYGKEGRLGMNSVLGRQSPCVVPALAGKDIIDISCGESHSLALDSKNQVWAWGRNQAYQLGLEDSSHRLVPTIVSTLLHKPITKVMCGQNSSYALTADGDLYSWGDNSQGQLGLGDCTPRKLPCKVESLTSCVQDISTSYRHLVLIALDHKVLSVKPVSDLEKKTVEPVKGIHILYSPEKPPMADIVFVGTSLESWRCPDGSLWIRDWLSRDVGDCRLIAVELNFEGDFWKSYQETIANRAKTLCNLLKEDPIRVGESHRPVIFIGHGLGGLVVKEIILAAEKDAPAIYCATKLVIFYGTPHNNGSFAMYCVRLAAGSANKTVTKDDLNHLVATNNYFSRYHHISSVSFGETEKIEASHVANELPNFTVPDAAFPCYRGPMHKQLSLDGNSASICQPLSLVSPNYTITLDEINRIVQDIRE